MTDPVAPERRPLALRARLEHLASRSLSRAQAIVGFLAAMLSIGGSMYGYVRATQPPDRGELVAFVREGRNDKAIIDATIEVLTPQDALVTSFTTTDQAASRRALKEGMYRVVARHPRFVSEARIVQVLGGQASEVRFRLYPRVLAAPLPSPSAKPPASSGKSPASAGGAPGHGAAHVLNEGVEGLKKIFR